MTSYGDDQTLMSGHEFYCKYSVDNGKKKNPVLVPFH